MQYNWPDRLTNGLAPVEHSRRKCMSTDKPRIGFIGVGLMGHGIAKNLVTKGFPLTVRVHRNRAPVDDLVAKGAKEVTSNAELARNADIVFLCVTGAPQVEEAIFGADGLAKAARNSLTIVDTSTSEPATTTKDRKSTRLNSSHRTISYAVFCLKKKTKNERL